MKKTLRAVCIAMAIVAFVPAVGMAEETVSWTSAIAESASVLLRGGSDGLSSQWSTDFVGRLASLDGVVQGVQAVPEVFAEECLDVSWRDGVMVVPDGPLVGFIGEGAPQDLFAAVSSELCGKGWTLLESGSGTQATFVKDEGLYRWAYVSCAEVPGATNVVIQCA